MVAEIERAAARVEPAHDELVAREHLLPVDAEVLPRLVRSARDGEAPSDERRDVVRPAGLHRKPREVDVRTLPHDLLARRRASLLRRHVHDLQEERPRVLPRILQALRRLRLLEEREQLADFAQRRDRILTHAHRNAFRCAEQVAEHRHPMALRPLEQDFAGPPALRTRSQISVISSRGSTSIAMRFSSPRCSSCARKSRRSEYFMEGN